MNITASCSTSSRRRPGADPSPRIPRLCNADLQRPAIATRNWLPKMLNCEARTRTLSAVITELTHETSGTNFVVSMPRKRPGR
jgi:hypothetical protein